MKTRALSRWSLFVWLALGIGLASAGAAQSPAVTSASRFDDKKAIPYRITRNDRLAVSVYNEPDLTSGNHRVEARGTINLQLVGDVRVVGMTLSEAADAVAKAYIDGRYLRNPQVTIAVEEYSPRVVNVVGKVKFPARVELPPEQQMTIKEVIMKCGGFEDTARGTAVRLTRTMPDGTPKTFILDVQSAILGKDRAAGSADASFVVEPDDVIYVPEKII